MSETTHDKLNAYNAEYHPRNDGSRETDMRALLKCASRLKEALDIGDKDMNFYREAIKYNQKLWTLFQVALTEPDNALPVDLKVNLLRVSRYIDRASFQAITKFAPHLINSLIDLNKTIAKGLARTPASSQPTTIDQPPVTTQSVMISA